MNESRKRTWSPLAWMVAIFFGPLIAAVVVYINADDWAPSARTNHGDLIDPARPLPQFHATAGNGVAVGVEQLKGKWTLLTLARQTCPEACEQVLYATRQVRTALGKNQDRVQRVLVVSGTAPKAEERLADRLGSTHPDLMVLHAGQPDFAQLARQLDGAEGAAADAAVYVIDPIGNVMMRYRSLGEPSEVLKDMNKLLRASRIG